MVQIFQIWNQLNDVVQLDLKKSKFSFDLVQYFEYLYFIYFLLNVQEKLFIKH